MTNCEKCGALMIESKRVPGKWYCSAKCWLPESERNNPQNVPKQNNSSNSSQPIVVINKNENADSIEWRLSTGKGVKVYCDSSKPEEAKQKLLNLIKVLNEVEIEFPPIEKH